MVLWLLNEYILVYDGHAGVKAAISAASYLHEKLVDSEHFHTDPSRAIQEAIVVTDKVI